MGHFLIIRHDLSLMCCKHSEWRILLRFFAGNLSLLCGIALKAMPHGSEKSPEKNRNEIRHSLCMPHGRGKIVANYEENDK